MVIEFPQWVGEAMPGILAFVVGAVGLVVAKRIHAEGQRGKRSREQHPAE